MKKLFLAAVFFLGVSGYAQAQQPIVPTCRYNTTAPAPNAGQLAEQQCDASGNVKTILNAAIPAGANTIGAVSNIATNSDTAALITLAAASVGVASADQVNTGNRGVQIGLNVTAITGTGTPSVQVIVEGKDAASGVYYAILTSAAITATGFTQLIVYPGATVAANVAVSQPLPKTWRVRTVIAGSTPGITATIGASLIL
jgi:hypothetical protein